MRLRKAHRANLTAADRFPSVIPAWHGPRTELLRKRNMKSPAGWSKRGKSISAHASWEERRIHIADGLQFGNLCSEEHEPQP